MRLRLRRVDPDNPSSIRSLARLAGNPNNKPAARNDHTAQPGAEPTLNHFALKPLALGQVADELPGQDIEPADGSDGTDGRWRIARRVAEDIIISVHDPEARHTRKSPEAQRDDYRAHVVADPETGIVNGEKFTKAARYSAPLRMTT